MWTHSSRVEEELLPSGGWGFMYCLHHSIKLGKNGILGEGSGTTNMNIQA